MPADPETARLLVGEAFVSRLKWLIVVIMVGGNKRIYWGYIGTMENKMETVIFIIAFRAIIVRHWNNNSKSTSNSYSMYTIFFQLLPRPGSTSPSKAGSNCTAGSASIFPVEP